MTAHPAIFPCHFSFDITPRVTYSPPTLGINARASSAFFSLQSEGITIQVEYGKILFINGTSSSGKTTLAKVLHPMLGSPFCYYASDQLADGGFRARMPFTHPPSERQRFFDGFHRSIRAFAEAGNNLIVDHIVEEQAWADDLQTLLKAFDVFWIGLHAPLEELFRREIERGDRTIGEASFHLKTHRYVRYDIEIQSTRLLEESVSRILEAWKNRLGVREPGTNL